MTNDHHDRTVLFRWWLAAAVLVLGAMFVAIVLLAPNRQTFSAADAFQFPALLLTFVLLVIPAPWGVARFAFTVGATLLFGAGFLYFALYSGPGDATEAIIGAILELAAVFYAARMFGGQQRLSQASRK